MKKAVFWILLIIVAVAVAWYLSVRRDMQDVEEAIVTPPAEQPMEPEPQISHPVEEIVVEPEPEPESEPEPEPLPALEESDDEVLERLNEAADQEAVERIVVPEAIISRVVATVDGLTSAQVAPLTLPVEPPPGKFEVVESGEEVLLSPDNSARYAPYVKLAESMDVDQLVGLYVRYYPLFQSAYADMGYPDAYFNDRLVEVIDLLLATPEPEGEIELRQNEAVYEYVDGDLEALTGGQKLLLRIGRENRAKIKGILRELKERLATEVPEAG